MNRFFRILRKKAGARRWRWRVVPCGSRRRAYETFSNARAHAEKDEIVILLVDAEEPVTAPTSVEHLRTRPGDGWDLTGVSERDVHLMVQTMETWIIADSAVLAAYYGQGFQASALPKHKDLEAVAKNTVVDALERATRRTQKGSYYEHKIHHAADLLKRMSPTKVQKHCPHAKRLFSTLTTALA